MKRARHVGEKNIEAMLTETILIAKVTGTAKPTQFHNINVEAILKEKIHFSKGYDAIQKRHGWLWDITTHNDSELRHL